MVTGMSIPAFGAALPRREFLKSAAAAGLGATLGRPASFAAATPEGRKQNVLFLMVDDMRPELSCYGNPLSHWPNLEALAAAGVRFDRGYCQFPLCNPSRSSMLTGRQVINTGVLGNRTWFGDLHPEFVSLPKFFRQHGYDTLRCGKIFHGGIDDTAAWTEGGEARHLAAEGQSDMAASAGRHGDHGRGTEIERYNRKAGSARGLTPAAYSDRVIRLKGDGEGHGDYETGDRAIEYLRNRRHSAEPFFLACGFVKPHSPPTAPEKYFDRIDVNAIPLPVDFAPHRTVPPGFPEGCLRPRNADLFIGRDATPQAAREVIQGYLASIAWTDWNIGRVIGELDRLGLRENTIIVFSADHGYQLGEKGKWSKAGSLWEEGARIPIILHAPGVAGNGQVCRRVVQTLNLYPTLVELCGLPPATGQEGHSMVPLLHNPGAQWDYPAFTVWSENGKTLTGIGVRFERWRYAEYDLGGAMLLDMENDPHQLKNLAHEPRYAEVVKMLSGYIESYKTSKV
jgi:iduronate 2-sulfatase